MDINTIDLALTTTRTVRKRLDLTRTVPENVIAECIEIATFAPSGSNRQGWHFVVVTDAELKQKVGELYRRSFHIYLQAIRAQQPSTAGADVQPLDKVLDSAIYLSEHMGEVPALILVCGDGRVEDGGTMAQAGFYGSLLPAAWSLMVALNARGIGSAWTTLHLRYEREVAEVLGIPQSVTQAVLIPIGYLKDGPSTQAKRKPSRERTYWNKWGKTQ